MSSDSAMLLWINLPVTQQVITDLRQNCKVTEFLGTGERSKRDPVLLELLLPPLTKLNYLSCTRQTAGKCARVVKATAAFFLPTPINHKPTHMYALIQAAVLKFLLWNFSSKKHDF
ncbi:hypothetical protein ILYODFUR_008681 [Ilyodon furcidens]|uniref:Uncharacterized protein n=1 Tax=Ilyodon furcidens TaxID=33524 RepID=A0ABV0UEY4_9TELE